MSPNTRQMTVLCVLPARLGSERIPRKPLQIVAGRPLLEWTWTAARRVPGVDHLVVATDSREVAEAAEAFGAEVRMTRADHPSGTDRVAEVAAEFEPDVVVNFQADEPFLAPDAVRRAIDAVESGPRRIATLAVPLRDEATWHSPSIVKVVRAADGRALYFSRAAVPHPRGGEPAWGEAGSAWLRHVGLYVFARDALARWVTLEPSRLERIERLEQLRALEAGMEIEVCVVPAAEPGIDVPDDIARADRMLRATHDAQEKRETHVRR